MRTVTLKAGRSKALWMGHPWVYADSIQQVEPLQGPDSTPETNTDADWVRVVDAGGKLLGHGLYSPRSTLRVRMMTRDETDVASRPVLSRRILRASALRARLFPDVEQTSAYRLIHGEGDGLPGLVVDRLGDVLVAQFGTAPIHARRDWISQILLEVTGAKTVVGRKAGFEEKEGIPSDAEAYIVGDLPPQKVLVREAGLLLETAPVLGQKTGHYADQRENRKMVGALAAGLEVLDLYAGTGGFSLQALRHGARRSLAVDASAFSLEMARANAGHNNFDRRIETQKADVKDLLSALRVSKTQFGLVVTDPPNFFPRTGNDRPALKAYRELNVRCLSRVSPGGFLATFSCSARMEPMQFLELLRSASRDCRRPFRVLRELAAGPDHPVAQALPEGRYLTGLLLQVAD